MYVCVYLSSAFRFSGRHHTDSITPSFFSNPRLGSSDRQPRQGILRWSCQPNHYMAAPHSRSNARWDPQVWLHTANGAAEPTVSTCTYIPLRSALLFFHTAPLASFLPQCITLAPWGFIFPPCPSPVYVFLSLLLMVCLWYPNLPTWQVLLSERCCKTFQTAGRGFWKTSLKWLQEEKEVFFQKMESLLLFNRKSGINGLASSVTLQRFLSWLLLK